MFALPTALRSQRLHEVLEEVYGRTHQLHLLTLFEKQAKNCGGKLAGWIGFKMVPLARVGK